MTDILSDILHRLRLRACVYFEREFRAPWAVRLENTGFAQFHVITSGAAVIEADGATHDLGTGDILCFPRGLAHTIADSAARQPVAGPDFMGSLARGTAMFTTGQRPMRMICGHFDYRSDLPHPLIADLPEMIHLPAAELTGLRDAGPVVRMILHELTTDQPGAGAHVERLAEVLMIQVLRAHFTRSGLRPGFYAGLNDARLGRAIALMHREYAGTLSLADLAAAAAMSRSAFSERFTATMGLSPIEYLQRWRMIVAQDLLQTTDNPVAGVAAAVGYGSDIAFSRAYRRCFGRSPSETRASVASSAA